MRAYSHNLRDRGFRTVERDEPPVAIAQRFKVSWVWVYPVRDRLRKDGARWVNRWMDTGAPAWSGSLYTTQRDQMTLVQMCKRLATRGVQIKAPAL